MKCNPINSLRDEACGQIKRKLPVIGSFHALLVKKAGNYKITIVLDRLKWLLEKTA
jgi:hypothetical protein